MLTIREATADDAALISRIFAGSWRVAYRGLLPDLHLDRLPDEYWLPTLRSWLGSGQMYGLIAMADSEPVGCIILSRGRSEGWEDHGEIVSLYVLPERTNSGAGTLLLKEGLRLLAQEGYGACYLWALEGNAYAERFYLKHGFRLTHDRFPYRIGGQDVADVRYVLDTL